MEKVLPFSKRFFTAFLRLTRFWNLMIIAFAQYFTAGFLIGSHTLDDIRMFLLSSSTVVIAAAGYIINDYYDIKIDFINKPERVVIGRSITRRYAILAHIILSAVGILLGVFLSLKIGAINLVSVFLLWLYSNHLKRLPFIGNFTVALLTGLSILVVDVLYPATFTFVLMYAVFAFFMTLVREIIKDMEDLKGDNTFGCKTLPIVWGLRKTKVVVYAVLAMLSVTVVLLNQYYARLAVYYFLLFLFVPLLLMVVWLARADKKKEFAWLSTFCKIIMLLGILSMAFV